MKNKYKNGKDNPSNQRTSEELSGHFFLNFLEKNIPLLVDPYRFHTLVRKQLMLSQTVCVSNQAKRSFHLLFCHEIFLILCLKYFNFTLFIIDMGSGWKFTILRIPLSFIQIVHGIFKTRL